MGDPSTGCIAPQDLMVRRQAVLDAVVILQGSRSRLAAAVASCGDVDGVEVLATGTSIPDSVMAHARAWRHVRSTQSDGRLDRVERSLPNNRACLASGLDMRSVWDEGGLDPIVRRLLECEDDPSYHFSTAPVEMKIIDRKAVMLHGPLLDGQPSVMLVRRSEVMAAAVRYWHAVWALAHRAVDDALDPVAMTKRQRQIVELLARDECDDSIAALLGVSVRTVRSDIAALMQELGVRSRFAAGMRCRELTLGS